MSSLEHSASWPSDVIIIMMFTYIHNTYSVCIVFKLYSKSQLTVELSCSISWLLKDLSELFLCEKEAQFPLYLSHFQVSWGEGDVQVCCVCGQLALALM